MKLSKRQKIAIGLLGTAVVALAADQLTKSPETVAVVAEDLSPVVTASAKPGAAAGNAVGNAAGEPARQDFFAFDASTAAALDALGRGPAGPRRDAFTPAESWIQSAPATDAAAAAATFQTRHHLKAVIQGARPSALVDSHLVAMGQTLDGFTLCAVAPAAATFRQGGVVLELQLPGATLSPPPADDSVVIPR